ncbi:MAG: RHS repeat-associated core domain-containing protein [Pseudomonadota bacterium]
MKKKVTKQMSDRNTYYVCDGVNIIEERVSDKTSATFTSLPLYKGELEGVGVDSIISMERDNDVYYYHTDTSGNIVALTDSKGALVERYSYSAYGDVEIHDAGGALLAQSGVDNPYLYSGREYDPETNLYYYRARTYNPELGRFMQQDPLPLLSLRGAQRRGNPFDLMPEFSNRYAYVMNNPINFVDPFGLARMAGNSLPSLNNPYGSSVVDFVDRNFGFGNNSDGTWQTLASIPLKPVAEYIRYIEQNYLSDQLFNAGYYSASAYVKSESLESLTSAYFSVYGAAATGAAAMAVSPTIGAAARTVYTTYGPVVGAAITAAGQQVWYRNQQVYSAGYNAYVNLMSWAGSGQGQSFLRITTDFVGGWFPAGTAPSSVAGGVGSAAGFFLGDPEIIIKEAIKNE